MHIAELCLVHDRCLAHVCPHADKLVRQRWLRDKASYHTCLCGQPLLNTVSEQTKVDPVRLGFTKGVMLRQSLHHVDVGRYCSGQEGALAAAAAQHE